jgi:phage terminase large subunit-like protein
MTAVPLFLTPVPLEDIARGDGRHVAEFIEGTPGEGYQDGFCRITKESVGGHYGDLIRVRPWQHETTGMVYARTANGRLRHREALIGLPRKNGKSALGSSYGLHGLVMGPEGGEVYSCAADKDQARIVFNVAKKMVQLDPELDGEQGGIIKVYRDALEYVETGSIYKVLSSEAFTKEGLNPTCVVYDELHAAPTDELYDVMVNAFGARVDPLLIIITTAGVKTDQENRDSICYRRYQYGVRVAQGEIDDPTFFMCWYGAPKNADYRDPAVWEAANPGYGDLIDPQDFVSVIGKVDENTFRTKRLNQWVSSVQAWLPGGAWDNCRNPDRTFVPGARGIVLGFDGSKNGDTTALVAVTVDSNPVVKVLGLWDRPEDSPEWKVPRGEVKDAIRQACHDFNVREIAWDEWLWEDAAEELEEEGLPVVAFQQTMSAMGPATQRFYEMVINGKIEHDGDPRLARHLENAQLKTETRGARLIKDAKKSPRKIDLAVASVMALDRAAWWLTQPVDTEPMYKWKDSAGTEHSRPVREIDFVW